MTGSQAIVSSWCALTIPHTDLEPGEEGVATGYMPITSQMLVDWDSGSRPVMRPDAGDIIERV
jgi:hypothetical protein